MKRFISILLSIIICFSFSVTAFASEDNGYNTPESSYDALLCQIDEEVRTLPTVTDGESFFSWAEMDNAIAEAFASTNLSRSAFYSTTVELANVLAAYDGVSYTNMATIMVHGYLAQSDAEGQTYEDAYRHSTWNFRATKALSASTVRIYTIDYEWANKLVQVWQNYYDERYNYYFDTYYTAIIWGFMDVTTIMTMAQSDADDYICAYKSSLQTSCRNSYSTFTSTFNNDNIMDWWNNKIGRDYGTNYSSYTPSQMFTAAYNANQLILSSSNVTSSHYSTVWSTNWWYTGT